MRQAKQYVARNRRNALVRWVAKKCANYLGVYENANWDFRTNGELDVLGALTQAEVACVFDVGANKGDWSLAAHERLPEAKIHAFEIVPETARILRSRTESLPRIRVESHGLGDREDDVEVSYAPGKSTVSTMLAPSGQSVVPDGVTVTGRTVRGDRYLAERGIGHVDLLKIDVEGAEHLVLQGFENTLAAGRIGSVQFEYGRQNLVSRFLLADFYELLERHGFRLGKIFPGYVEFRDYSSWHENFAMSNYLAVHRDRDDLRRLLG